MKNHLTSAYRRLGARTGPQAVFILLGGEGAVATLPPARDRRQDTCPELGVLRARVRILERELRGRPRPDRRIDAPPDVPTMVDGEITMAQLRAAAARYDADMDRTSEMQMTCREWAELLAYHVLPSQARDPRAAAVGGPGPIL